MKIAFLTGRLRERASGVSVAVERLSAALAERGVDVQVFGIADGTEGLDRSWAGAPAVACRSFGPRAFGYAPDLAEQLRQCNFDLVHLHGLWMHSAVVATRWATCTGRSLMISPHGMLSPIALSISPVRKRLARLAFQDNCLRYAAGFHATSEREAADVREFGLRQPLFVFPNGIDEPLVPPLPVEQRQNRVLFLGRLHRVKGLEQLLLAWASVERERPDWRLEIVGPGEDDYVSSLHRLVQRLHLRQVQIRGAVEGREKDALLGASKLLVLPTLSENFAMVVAEALICETPVICTEGAPWQGLRDHNCGWWVGHGDAHLAEALRTATELTDPQRQEKGRAGRAWMMRSFTWASAAESAEAAYHELIAAAAEAGRMATAEGG